MTLRKRAHIHRIKLIKNNDPSRKNYVNGSQFLTELVNNCISKKITVRSEKSLFHVMCGDSTEISHNKFIAFSVYNSFLSNVYVVVNLLCQVIFVFLLFWGMAMVLMEIKQEKNKYYLR